MKARNLARLVAAVSGVAAPVAAHAQYVIVNNLPGTFTDISATGALIASNNGGAAPFTSSVTNALVTNALLFGGLNGHVANARFDQNGSNLNTALPVPLATLGFFPLWDNLAPGFGGALRHATTVEGESTVEVIQWSNVYVWANGSGSPLGSFELKIFSSGPVYAQYIYQWSYPSFAGGGSSATIGLQWSATDLVQYSFNTANSVASGTVLSIVSDGTGGACCLPSGVCAFKNAANCLAANGIFRGVGAGCGDAGCPQPPQGACCLPGSMACTMVWQVGCTAQGGVYRGDGTSCSVGGCAWGWTEQRDAEELLNRAQVVAGSGSLPGIYGQFGYEGDIDVYQIQICDAANFSATTVNALTSPTMNTMLFLFDSTGHGVTFDDDDPQDPTGYERRSRLTSQFVPGNGVYYLAISGTPQYPLAAPDPVLGLPALPIWLDFIELVSGFPRYNIEHRPDGPTTADKPFDSWGRGSNTHGPYYITLTGACYVAPAAPPCYANCDNSTTPPVLNIADFTCFLQKFAVGCP